MVPNAWYLGTDIIPDYFVPVIIEFSKLDTTISDAYMWRKSADARAASVGIFIRFAS